MLEGAGGHLWGQEGAPALGCSRVQQGMCPGSYELRISGELQSGQDQTLGLWGLGSMQWRCRQPCTGERHQWLSHPRLPLIFNNTVSLAILAPLILPIAFAFAVTRLRCNFQFN